MLNDLYLRTHACLMACDVAEKLAGVDSLNLDLLAGRLAAVADSPAPVPMAEPGRPPRPLLVSPREVPRRRLGTAEGRAALIHAVVHIEFNAINLALDHVYRFREFPMEFAVGWVAVAAEEAHHFTLLRDHLRGLGFDYGDFTAHDGLWQMSFKTAHDPLARMALVPRTLEARGLDVTPGIQARLEAAGDDAAARLLDIILADEVGHVALGDRWFRWLCQARGLIPEVEFRRLLLAYDAPRMASPMNRAARRLAGFGEEELDRLEAGAPNLPTP